MPEMIAAGSAGGAALAVVWWLLARERAARQPLPLPVRSRRRQGGAPRR